MATVIGVTAQRAEDIENRLVKSARKQGTSLVLETVGGNTINVPNAFQAPYELYPIGSIYITTNSANPATYMGGGTWVRWGQGRVPVSLNENDSSFDTVEEVGGAKTHTLTVNEMPHHAHGSVTGNENANHTHSGTTSHGGEHSHAYEIPDSARTYGSGGLGAWNSFRSQTQTGVSGGHSHTFSTSGVSDHHGHPIWGEGGGQAHNNLQPYIVAYMWKRTK